MSNKISNWGNYPKVLSEERSFSSLSQLDKVLQSNSQITPRGLGRSYGDASLGPSILSTLKYNRVISFDKETGIFEAQAGISLERILEIVIPYGWFLPVTPGTKYITLGGAIASDIHGKNHHSEGNFSNHLYEIKIIQENGNIITSSPQLSPDLFRATCGGMGLTGMILSGKIQLKKIETSYIKKIEIRAKNLDHIMALFEEYKSYTYSMAWIDCLKRGKGFGRSIMMAGEHALLSDLKDNQIKNPLILSKKPKLSIPFNFPNFILNPITVKSFNFLYYNIHKEGIRENIIPYDPFFYPLDSILNWNRMYGSRGFIQYQLVLPLIHSRKGLEIILSRINKENLGSFLAVLKLFGKEDGLISFPMEGYTLALDFPVQAKLFPFLSELDKIVLDLGGRIYLTKDARMTSETFYKSYPRIEEFKTIVEKYNPQLYFKSRQSDRLGITKNQKEIQSSQNHA